MNNERELYESAVIENLKTVLLDAGYPEGKLDLLLQNRTAADKIQWLKFLVRHWRANTSREG